MSVNLSHSSLSFEELISAVNHGNSVRCEYHYKRIDEENEETIYKQERTTKEWQLEKQDDMYCFKTFDCYERANKSFFTIKDEQLLLSAFINMRNYIEISKEGFKDIFNIDSDWFIEKKDFNKQKNKVSLFSERNWSYENKNVTETRTVAFKQFKTKKTINGKVQKTGEDDIRIELDKYIKEEYPNESDKDEYTTYPLKSRADKCIFTKNGIHVFEIKSEKDSFARLENQIKDYKTYAEKVTIVLHVKKLSAFMKNHTHLLDGVGLMVYYNKDIPLEMKIKPKKLIPVEKKLFLLWSQELADLLSIFRGCSKCTSSHTREIVASEVFTKQQAHKITNIILSDRFSKKTTDKKQVNYGGISMQELAKIPNYNLENLQKKFERAIKNL